MDELIGIWIPAGIMFAFQIEMVRWRIDRETKMEHEGERTWLPVCDYLNLFSMAATAFGVFVVPIVLLDKNSGALSLTIARLGIGLTAIFLIGYLLSLIGHYRLYVGGQGPRPHMPLQELIPVALTIVAAFAYLLLVAVPQLTA